MTLNGHYALLNGIMHSITLHACVLEPTTKICMQRDPYCQRRKCSPVNVLSSDIRVMQTFAGVREIWGRSLYKETRQGALWVEVFQ